ncbi:MAG: hypothetical protein QHJ73_03770, partial [Armatimonadota bacterium]|nr:hypothetical protein [Armatimonadota bacterium]
LIRVDLSPACHAGFWRPGSPNQSLFRALDAFILTARRHRLPVLFTLFRGLPPAAAGSNPYVDRRAISAQQEVLAAMAERYREAPGVMWDLLCRPSLFLPTADGEGASRFDTLTRQAWQGWVSARDPEEVREAWRITSAEPIDLPREEELRPGALHTAASSLKALDYRLFGQQAFADWVSEQQLFLRRCGGATQPVTVGQQGRAAGTDPDPRFYARYVDFTSMGGGSPGNDVLWRGVMGRWVGKPCLLLGTDLPSPDQLAGPRLLERTVALSLAAGCAGTLAWAWQTGLSGTEPMGATGLLRADGSATPAAAFFTALSRFLWRNRALFEQPEPERVVMLVPQSRLLAGCVLANTATQACVRTFFTATGTPLRAVGEYSPEELGRPDLILIPSARVLRQHAWEAVLACVEEGAAALVTGPIDADPYGRPVDRLASLGVAVCTRPAAREEDVLLEGERLRLRFGTPTEKAVTADEDTASVRVLPYGRGRVIFAPLPFELADDPVSLARLYQFALNEAGLSSPFTVQEPDPGVLVCARVFARAVLYVAVSELGREHRVSIQHGHSPGALSALLPPQGSFLLFLDRDSGVELDRYPSAGADAYAVVV